MDDHPDRRPFLDKLLSFMEEKGTPITQCPTISKNPLDLFRLYLYTKERGGFIEVSYPKIIRILFQSKSKDPDHFFLFVKSQCDKNHACKITDWNFQCTKQKTWKDIAAQLGIGASSSGAYTLKKHYGKNLLPFECYYDRGGVDPGPILAQVSTMSLSYLYWKYTGRRFEVHLIQLYNVAGGSANEKEDKSGPAPTAPAGLARVPRLPGLVFKQ